MRIVAEQDRARLDVPPILRAQTLDVLRLLDHAEAVDAEWAALASRRELERGTGGRAAIWWFVHHAVAHPLMALMESPSAMRFHDWIIARAQCRDEG